MCSRRKSSNLARNTIPSIFIPIPKKRSIPSSADWLPVVGTPPRWWCAWWSNITFLQKPVLVLRESTNYAGWNRCIPETNCTSARRSLIANAHAAKRIVVSSSLWSRSWTRKRNWWWVSRQPISCWSIQIMHDSPIASGFSYGLKTAGGPSNIRG